jgi:RHS repeat-associated protein
MSGQSRSLILTGLAVDERFARTDLDGRTDFLSDALNSTIALTNSAGAIVEQYSYDPYGTTTASVSGFDNPYQYTGRENDGDGLYYYRARYYAPAMGRFISEDPLELASGSMNFYAYVGNNPLMYTDPYGLAWQLIIGGGGTVIVPFFGGGLNFNIGVNIDGWHSSAYIQDQANLGAPGAGGAFVGAGLNLSLTHADAPTTGFDSAKYFEADAGYLGGLGVTGTENGCHGIDLSGIKGIKPGVGLGLGAFVGTTYTATAVSPTIGSLFGH